MTLSDKPLIPHPARPCARCFQPWVGVGAYCVLCQEVMRYEERTAPTSTQPNEKCFGCLGVGKVLLEDGKDTEAQCKYCKGSGRVKNNAEYLKDKYPADFIAVNTVIGDGATFAFARAAADRFVRVTMQQAQYGYQKYGKVLDPFVKDANGKRYDWLDMMEQELVDANQYIQCERAVRNALRIRVAELESAVKELTEENQALKFDLSISAKIIRQDENGPTMIRYKGMDYQIR